MGEAFEVHVFRGRYGGWKASVRGEWGYIVSPVAFGTTGHAAVWASAVAEGAAASLTITPLTQKNLQHFAGYAAALIISGGG